MQLSDALLKFTIQWEANGRSRHTIGQYNRHLLLFARWLRIRGECDALETIDHETVACFLASNMAKARADGIVKKASSTNALRASLKGFFRYCHDAGYVAKDPTRFVRKANCAPPPQRALSEGEIAKLREALAICNDPAGRRDRVLFELLLQTGIRLGSALGTDGHDFDRDRGTLLLRTTKGSRPTTITIPPGLLDELAALATCAGPGPIFQNPAGWRLSARCVQRRFQQWLARAGVNRYATPHSLRHTFATDLYRATKDVLLVKESLRHRSIASTLVYSTAQISLDNSSHAEVWNKSIQSPI